MLKYTNDPRIAVKIHTAGMVLRSGRIFWEKALAHVPCGCVVKKTERGWYCHGCGIISPVFDDILRDD